MRTPMPRLRSVVAALAGLGLLLAGCTPSSGGTEAVAAEATTTAPPVQPASPPATEQPMELTGAMSLTPDHGPAGTSVRVSGSDLPASSQLSVMWSTVACDWALEGEQLEEYHGRTCDPQHNLLASVQTDADGALSADITIPDEFGFAHDVLLVDTDGVIRNKALFDVDMTVSVTPTSGPVGTPITIEVHGIGWQTMEDSRTILYDNRYVGFMSAVSTEGTATAVIPATGAVGPHRIDIDRGAYTFPYLNPAQSPRPDIPVFDATFTITDGDPVLPPPVTEQNPPATPAEGQAASTSGPWMRADLGAGAVGDQLTLSGSGFAADASVDLRWFRIVGNRVGGQGWDEQDVDFTSVTADGTGAFTVTQPIPGDVGGAHRIEAVVDGKTVAQTSVRILPQAMPLEADRVSWGDPITLHLTGVGWTETANIFTIVYDNAYIGYACGFNTQGSVEVPLTATGAPGWHFIDLYPAIYKGKETPGRQNFRIPQLTYAQDHPGEDLPAFHYAFYLEP